jgi:hypothetical protein
MEQGSILYAHRQYCPKNAQSRHHRAREKTLVQLRLQGAALLPANGNQDLDILVLAQHYGLHTRLLDWTSNPLAALWFACSSATQGDVFVYALIADHLQIEQVYESDPFAQGLTRIFQPRLNNSRIVAQQGWFTLHCFSSLSKQFVALEKNQQTKQYLTEYRIPADRRSELLMGLDRHGVNAKATFSDLGGICQHLNWKHLTK